MTKKQVGEERVYLAYTSILLFITKEVRTRTQAGQEAELMQRPWRDVPYWLASPSLLSLLSYRTKTTSPEMASPTRGLSPLITNWEKCLTAGSHGGIFSTEAPFPVITPACVKLTPKTGQYSRQIKTLCWIYSLVWPLQVVIETFK